MQPFYLGMDHDDIGEAADPDGEREDSNEAYTVGTYTKKNRN